MSKIRQGASREPVCKHVIKCKLAMKEKYWYILHAPHERVVIANYCKIVPWPRNRRVVWKEIDLKVDSNIEENKE